jgi:predicted acylesterase/phospholipase RssA
LSFVNPLIKAHDDANRKNCYFHRKLHKPEIRASMDSGYICDQCIGQLDYPAVTEGAKKLSDDEREALTKMRQFVSGDLPYAIVMKGGGVKGLAFAGALLELEKYFWFDRHVGASAGAIAAVLLAASYTPSELTDLLFQKDFSDFMDAPFWRIPINLLLRQGCYPGEAVQNWITELLIKKIPQIAEIPMAALRGALIYASRRGTGTIAFDSVGERKQVVAAFAVRCSMSIPFFFFPTHIDGRRVFDGGLRNNFPLKRFLDDHPRSNFIALYLGKPDSRTRRGIGSELVDIVVEGEERKTVDDNIRNVVVIDTSPIGTVDFRLDTTEKQFLLKVGKAAALHFLDNRKLDDGPSKAEVDAAQADADRSRILVRRLRQHRRTRRCVVGLLLVFVAIGSYFIRKYSVN